MLGALSTCTIPPVHPEFLRRAQVLPSGFLRQNTPPPSALCQRQPPALRSCQSAELLFPLAPGLLPFPSASLCSREGLGTFGLWFKWVLTLCGRLQRRALGGVVVGGWRPASPAGAHRNWEKRLASHEALKDGRKGDPRGVTGDKGKETGTHIRPLPFFLPQKVLEHFPCARCREAGSRLSAPGQGMGGFVWWGRQWMPGGRACDSKKKSQDAVIGDPVPLGGCPLRPKGSDELAG